MTRCAPVTQNLRIFFVATCLAATLAAVGCGGRSTLRESERPATRAVADLGEGYFEERVESFVVPPTGWVLDKEKVEPDNAHLVWLSPTGDTAYGMIFFEAPAFISWLPKGSYLHGKVLDAFMDEFRKDQGEGVLLSKQWDDKQDAMRFVAEGGLYKIRPILRVRGRNGWAVYAGTLRERDENPEELAIATKAREVTRVGTDAAGGADAAARRLKAINDAK